jgi:hypothetical protein
MSLVAVGRCCVKIIQKLTSIPIMVVCVNRAKGSAIDLVPSDQARRDGSNGGLAVVIRHVIEDKQRRPEHTTYRENCGSLLAFQYLWLHGKIARQVVHSVKDIALVQMVVWSLPSGMSLVRKMQSTAASLPSIAG